MNYKMINDTGITIVMGAIERLGLLEALDQETIEYLLIKFDKYLDWSREHDNYAPELNYKTLTTAFFNFYHGFCYGANYMKQISENSDIADSAINNMKEGKAA